MNNISIATGFVFLVFGIVFFLYAEYIRRKEEMDIYNFKLYIAGIGFIVVGLIVIFKEL